MNDDGVVSSGIRVVNAKWRGAWFPRGILCTGIAFRGISDYRVAMVRQFKYHEQKLLKKVDFLNVCDRFIRAIFIYKSFSSGSKMPTFERSKSCVDTIYKIGKTTTSMSRVSIMFFLRPPHFGQVQQTMRVSTVFCTQDVTPPSSRPISITNGGPTVIKVV